MYATLQPRSSLAPLNSGRLKRNRVLFPHEQIVGNRIIDSEHKKLQDIINGIAGMIAEGELAGLPERFELLENSLCAYFAIEERIAQALDFDFEQHGLAHQYLLHNFKRIRDELMARDGMWSRFEEEGYIRSMMVYLDRHIKVESHSFKTVLDTRPYDFNPG